MNENLTRSEKLKSRKDLSRVFKKSSNVSVRGAKLLYLENGLPFSRFGVTLVRKYGTAVKRNRAKRVLREVFRRNKHQIKPGFDLVCLLFPGIDNFSEREGQFIELLKKADVVIKNNGIAL